MNGLGFEPRKNWTKYSSDYSKFLYFASISLFQAKISSSEATTSKISCLQARSACVELWFTYYMFCYMVYTGTRRFSYQWRKISLYWPWSFQFGLFWMSDRAKPTLPNFGKNDEATLVLGLHRIWMEDFHPFFRTSVCFNVNFNRSSILRKSSATRWMRTNEYEIDTRASP